MQAEKFFQPSFKSQHNHRRHDCLCRKSERIDKTTPGTNNQL